jgi:spore coat protein CotH
MTDLYYAMCVPAYRQIPIKLFIGDQYYSIFLMTEWFDGNFVARTFGRAKQEGDQLMDMGYGENFAPRASESPISNLIDAIATVSEDNFDDLRKSMDIDRVLAAMAVDLTTGQWDDFYRNYNNFFLFKEVHGGHKDFFYLIPFDCDWAFHRSAFFNQPGQEDSTGIEKNWDNFCCIDNNKRSGGNKLVEAIMRNHALKQKLLENIMKILTQYMLPLDSGLLLARDQQMWHILQKFQTDEKDPLVGQCNTMFKQASEDDHTEIYEFVKTKSCLLLEQIAKTGTDLASDAADLSSIHCS